MSKFRQGSEVRVLFGDHADCFGEVLEGALPTGDVQRYKVCVYGVHVWPNGQVYAEDQLVSDTVEDVIRLEAGPGEVIKLASAN